MRFLRTFLCALAGPLILYLSLPGVVAAQQGKGDTFDRKAILESAEKFFGETSEGLAKTVEKAFKDHGRPLGYIAGTEVSGAVVVGVRYGEGVLYRKGGRTHKVYWQGPSIGLDLGGDASKVFTLVYKLKTVKQLFQRFPAVDGSLYVFAGVGLNYQQAGDIIIAPIRTGVGLRAGINLGYTHYTREKSWLPL